jgi:hypothetical protein
MKWGGYRSRIAKAKAIMVVAHALIVIIWHVLATGKPYDDLGADYFTRRTDPDREASASSPSSKPSATTSPCTTPPDPHTPEADGPNRRRLLPPARTGTIHVSVPKARQ